MEEMKWNGVEQRGSVCKGKRLHIADYEYIRQYKVRNGDCIKGGLGKIKLQVTSLFVVFFHFHHPVLILAAVLHAGLLCFHGCRGLAAAAGLIVFFAHLDIYQLTLAVMQMHCSACGAAQVDKSQYENQELFHATQK